MKLKNRSKLEFWMQMLWTGQVYGTRKRIENCGAPRAAIRRFHRACSAPRGLLDVPK